MKANFLKELRMLLQETQASKAEIDEIIEDYDQLYEDARQNVSNESEIIHYLGTPEAIVEELKDTFKLHPSSKKKHKLVAVSPFVSVAAFFFIGFYLHAFHIAWLVFLLIPITAVLSEGNIKKASVPLTVFLSVITFFLIGFYANAWHPGWMVFLAIPVASIAFSKENLQGKIVGLMPFVTLITYLLVGLYFNWYHPTWLIFLLIPMVAILFHKSLLHKVVYEVCFLTAIGLYLYLGYVYGIWRYGAVVFIIPFAYGVFSNDIKFFIHSDLDKASSLKVGLVFLVSLAIYVLITLMFHRGFAWGWMVLLSVPMYAVLAFGPRPFKWVTIMPFITLLVFYTLGFFFKLWHVSWLAFLLIPVVAILEE